MSLSSSHHNHPALRFLTAGQVDDGKSTLIDRLLYDTHSLKDDHLEHLQRSSGEQHLNFASLSDGLLGEQERHITIDVAHHYLHTSERAFILLDAPGHEEYTCNMATAASTCDAAVILVDASRSHNQLADIPQQTKRHTLLAHLLRIPSIIFAINKLDLVSDPVQTFIRLQNLLQQFCAEMQISFAGIIPISALLGINIVHPLKEAEHPLMQQLLQAYNGPPLLGVLSKLHSSSYEADAPLPLHLPIQYTDTNTAWGRIATGKIHVDDEVTLQPDGVKTKILQLFANALKPPQTLAYAQAGQSIGIKLKDQSTQLKHARGQWLEHTSQPCACSGFIKATLIWFDQAPCNPEQTYLLKHQHTWVKATITHIFNHVDLNDLQTKPVTEIRTNTIAEVMLSLEKPLPVHTYATSRTLGAFILVNPHTHQTSAAGLVLNSDSISD